MNRYRCALCGIEGRANSQAVVDGLHAAAAPNCPGIGRMVALKPAPLREVVTAAVIAGLFPPETKTEPSDHRAPSGAKEKE